MDIRDIGTLIVCVLVLPIFIVIFGAALLICAPVLLPYWLWQEWKKRHA